MFENKWALKTTTVAQLGEMSDRFVRQLCVDGKLEAVKVGSEWRIPVHAVRQLLGQKEEARESSEVSTATA